MTEPTGDRGARARGDDVRHVTSPQRPPSRSDIAVTKLEAGTVIGGFRLLTPIGQGGMGRVFLAHDDQLDRKVALKVLPPEEADDEGRARFLREARALARVDHPHVVHVFASGIDKELAWMALEYIEGDPLCDALAAGPFDEETALSLAAQTARGLAAVHEVGVVHRDVKPDNLLLDDDGLVRLVDFGVALFEEPGLTGGFTTRAGIAVGTPHYMAPEQARGGRVDHRVDAWAVGATLWALLVGRPPFYKRADEADMDILARVLQEPVRDVRRYAKVSRGTAELLRALLEKDADKRPGDLAQIAEHLEALADEAMRRADSGAPPDDELADGELKYLDEDDLAAREDEKAEEAARAAEIESARELPTPVAGVRVRTDLASSEHDDVVQRAPSGQGSKLARGMLLISLLCLLGAAALVVIRLATMPEVGVGEPLTRELPSHASGAATNDDVDPKDLVLQPSPLVVPPAPAEPAVPDVAREPTPEERVAALVTRVQAGGTDGDRALSELLDDESEPAKAAVRTLVIAPDGVGSRVISALSTRRSSPHVAALELSLFGTSKALALETVTALESLRNVEALQLLQRAAKSHDDRSVRRAAFKAHRAMFSVEE